MSSPRGGDRHRRAPVSVRFPLNIWNLLDLARGKQSRNQFVIDAVRAEIRRRLGKEVLTDD